MEKEIIDYIVSNEHGTRNDLIKKAREIVSKEPALNDELKTKQADWMIKKLELLGYIRQGQDPNKNATWRRTENAVQEAVILRTPTFKDKAKGHLLRHLFGFSIEL